MNEFAGRLAGPLVRPVEEADALEFEARLADSSALAFRVAFSVLRQRQDAEDVAQQAFVRAYRRFSSLRDREHFRSWLVRMTWRLALDHRRGEKRRVVREDRAAAPLMTTSTVETEALADERKRRLWAAIDQLPEKLRLVIVLAAIEEQSVRDIAALAKVPEGTVKSRLFDARKRLQELLR